jgi:hypothetical protein
MAEDLPALPAEQYPPPHQDPASSNPRTLVVFPHRFVRPVTILVIIATTSSQLLIPHPNGWKLFPFPPLAQQTALVLLYFLITHFGVPDKITPDHGLQFTSDMLSLLQPA